VGFGPAPELPRHPLQILFRNPDSLVRHFECNCAILPPTIVR
jgi:hypothetical protein